MKEMAVWKVGNGILVRAWFPWSRGGKSCPGPLLSSIFFLNDLSDW